jgi:multiple sugar transport system permease protein
MTDRQPLSVSGAPASRSLSVDGQRQLSRSRGRLIGSIFTYTLLILGGIVMIFPLFWMFTASFKPEWQILAQPPIWIPSEWIQARGGSTPYEFPIWIATDSTGQPQEVIKIGVRRFTTVVDAASLPPLQSVHPDNMTRAVPTEVNGVMLNVRQWTQADGSVVNVVALIRDGDNLVIAPADLLANSARQMPLDIVNAGQRVTIEANGYSFQTRSLEDGSGIIALGPESELTVVAPRDITEQAFPVPIGTIGGTVSVPVGSSVLNVHTLNDRTDGEYYVELSVDSWQPIIDLADAQAFAFTVANGALTDSGETRTLNSAVMPLDTADTGDGDPIEVIVLLRERETSLVIPTANTQSLRLTPLGKLALPFVRNINGTAVRYREDYQEDGERLAIAIVGDRRDMAMVVPEDAIAAAYDVPSGSLHPLLVTRFYYENYVDAFSKDLGGANFLTFYRNSALLVILNLVGHFFSVTLVAYGFARLNAPGKNVFFLILLSTMMLPFPVLLIPTFEIFQRLGMINTLWPLFIRSFFGNAFLIFLLRQFLMSIPRELEDAARIDGANTLQVMWLVMLPLSKPALATIGIFTFWWTWNAFLEPYVYLSSVWNFTVSLGLGFFQSQYTTSYHLLMAASMVAIIPLVLIFFFAQRYFIEGIQLTGLKG